MAKKEKSFRVPDASRFVVDDPSRLTQQELAAVVRRASKAANQRLRDVEKAVKEGKEETKGEAYAYMERVLANEGRTRFKERTTTMTVQQLRQEYKRVITYLDLKSSSAGGRAELGYKKWQAYKKRGYDGSEESFKELCRKLWSKEMVSKYGSAVIYEVVTSGDKQLYSEWSRKADNLEAEDSMTAGKALLDVLRKKAGK